MIAEGCRDLRRLLRLRGTTEWIHAGRKGRLLPWVIGRSRACPLRRRIGLEGPSSISGEGVLSLKLARTKVSRHSRIVQILVIGHRGHYRYHRPWICTRLIPRVSAIRRHCWSSQSVGRIDHSIGACVGRHSALLTVRGWSSASTDLRTRQRRRETRKPHCWSNVEGKGLNRNCSCWCVWILIGFTEGDLCLQLTWRMVWQEAGI